jgi:hypothetical protein
MTTRTLIPNAPLLDEQGNITPPWLQVLRIWGVTVQAVRASGTTAQRPTSGLWVGQQFYDTTLNQPIWCYDVALAAAGAGGWADADGMTI